MIRIAKIAILASVIAAGGCSQTASNLLTGSVTDQSQAAAPVVTPADRALHVAATSARAQKCGYYFDPEQLKASYLTFETSNGLPVEQVAGVEKLYNFTSQKIATEIASDAGYCSEERTATIKAQLNKYLAGDYAPPPKKQEVQSGGWFDADVPQGKEKINPRWYEKGADPIIRTE